MHGNLVLDFFMPFKGRWFPLVTCVSGTGTFLPAFLLGLRYG